MTGQILFLDQSGHPGGAELCLADIAGHFREQARVLLFSRGSFEKMLLERGISVSIIDTPSSLASLGKNTEAIRYLFALPQMAGFLGTLRKEIRPADLVYLNTAKALLYGIAAGIGFQKASVFHLHDLLTREHFSRLNLQLLVRAANRCRAVIANSTATATAYRSAGGTAPVQVIPNGFESSRFAPLPAEELAAVRQELHSSTGPVAAVFGRIARWKGQDVLLRAAAEIPGLRVWVVGAPFYTGDDHLYAAELRELASLPALAGRVEFLGQREDIPLLMQAADIVVHTSVAPEPFGRVVAEGMFSRRAVVASRSGGPAEMIRHGETGWLFNPGDSDALVAVLRQVLTLPDCGRGTGLVACLEAEKNYSLPAVLKKTDALLSEVMSK